jgi:hypothetical protein
MTGGRLILLAAVVAMAAVIGARCTAPAGKPAALVMAAACGTRGCDLGR